MPEQAPRGIPRYRIEGEIGRGGMGVVYRALDTKLDRSVALKVLPPEVARDPTCLKRLEHEARTLASLNHPNIATIHTIEEAGDGRFLVLELVAGESLSRRLQRGPLAIAEALSAAAQVAAALAAAHERGVIHRDLKPSNVMLTSGGRVKVLDFGLAMRAISASLAPASRPGDRGSSQAGGIVGTPGYMSPEQARAQPVDQRTDIWAFGCVLYAAITGRDAFTGRTWQHKCRATLEEEPDWAALDVRTPPEIVGLLHSCLEKDPSRRLADIAEAKRVLARALSLLSRPGPDLRRPPSTANNLPTPVSRSIPRAREEAEVRDQLAATRLVTLTGVGGCGKTHLALGTARGCLGEFPDGVWLVELAALADPDLVARAVVATMGLQEEVGSPPLMTLKDRLRDRKILLVLDNCEHLLKPSAELSDELLRACPQLSILATSREGLGVPGERTYTVSSLRSPDPTKLPPLEALADYEAVQLFVERASASRGDFLLNEGNAPAVAQVCHRLDGIPLALELAAARVKVLSVEQIAERLDDTFSLLTGGSRTTLPRHRTLRAAIDWSFDLLAAEERTLVSGLAVFAGGFTLEAAEVVCSETAADGELVLDRLTHLVERSLVIVEAGASPVRYRFLETVRQYARDRLLESGASLRLRERHRDYFLAWAEGVEPSLLGPAQADLLARLEVEHDNLRAALEWSLVAKDGAEPGLRLALALLRFWEMRGHLGEGRRRLEKALAHAGTEAPPHLRAMALEAAGVLAERQGDYPTAQALLEETLDLFGMLGDRRGVALSLNNLGNVCREQGDLERAQSLYRQSLEIFRQIGFARGQAISLGNLGLIAHHRSEIDLARDLFSQSLALARETGDNHGIARALNNLGLVALDGGEPATARGLYKESLALKRQLGDRRGIAHTLGNLGRVAQVEGESAVARCLFHESLALFHELGFRPGMAWVLEAFAALEASLGRGAEAARLLGAAEALREQTRAPLRPDELRERDRLVGVVRAGLIDDLFAGAWSAGREMQPEEMLALCAAVP